MNSLSLVATECAEDLDDPRCGRHWSPATFTLTWDREQRELACDQCIADEMRQALRAESFCPPEISPIGLDLHREWVSA